MKALSIAGTAAMFLVGGDIITHGIDFLHHAIEHVTHSLKESGGIGSLFAPISGSVLDGLCGLIAGTVVLVLWMGIQKLRGKTPAH